MFRAAAGKSNLDFPAAVFSAEIRCNPAVTSKHV